MDAIPKRSSRAELALAIFEYALDDREYNGRDPWAKAIMPTVKKSIDRSVQNALNGRKGGQKSVESRSTATSDANTTASSDASSDASSTAQNTYNNNNNFNELPFTSNEVQKENKEKAERSSSRTPSSKFDFKGYLLEHGASEQAVNDWLEVRKKKRAANTLSAIRKLESEASKAGISLAEAVDMCAGNSWQSLKAEWVQGVPTIQAGQDDLDSMAKQWRQQLEEMRAADGREPGQFKDL